MPTTLAFKIHGQVNVISFRKTFFSEIKYAFKKQQHTSVPCIKSLYGMNQVPHNIVVLKRKRNDVRLTLADYYDFIDSQKYCFGRTQLTSEYLLHCQDRLTNHVAQCILYIVLSQDRCTRNLIFFPLCYSERKMRNCIFQLAASRNNLRHGETS